MQHLISSSMCIVISFSYCQSCIWSTPNRLLLLKFLDAKYLHIYFTVIKICNFSSLCAKEMTPFPYKFTGDIKQMDHCSATEMTMINMQLPVTLWFRKRQVMSKFNDMFAKFLNPLFIILCHHILSKILIYRGKRSEYTKMT